jgi:uncharacterized protein
VNHRILSSLLFAAAAAAQTPAQPHVVFITGDDEYRSEYSMPAVARTLESRHGMKTSVAFARPTPQTPDNIEGLEALRSADLAVFFLRFRQLPPAQMQYILDYLKSGKPLAGLRTTTHSFHYAKDNPLSVWNDGLGIEVFGQKWFRHHGAASSTKVAVLPSQAANPVLRGVAPEFQVRSWLYEVAPLQGDCLPLLDGASVNPQGKDASPQPVAWTKTYRGARVFFTTMGHPEDFREPSFRKLLINGILWALGKEIPAGGAASDFAVEYNPPPSGFPKQAP